MKVSIGQTIILILLLFLLFGDFQKAKKPLVEVFKKINNFFQK